MPRKTTQMTVPSAGTVGNPADDRSAHHPFGPSRWPALMECPCWQGKPGGDAAERGTQLHAIFEEVLKGNKHEPRDTFEENVIRAAESILAMAGTPQRWWIEERVQVYTPGGAKTEIYGRVDVAWKETGGDLHVVDLKMVENPDRNHRPQLLPYAFGLIGEEPVPATIHLHMAYADSGKVTHEALPIAQAWREYVEVYGRIDSIMHSPEPLPPVQSGWCNLCTSFAECQAPRAVAQNVAGTLADAPEHWPEFTSARKAQLCVLADAVIKWGESIKEHASEDAKAGIAIQDESNGIYYTTQERKGRLVIPDVQQAWEILKPYLTAEGYRGCLSVNQTELKSALKLAGLKPAEVNATIERCGNRLPPTLVFVRRSA